MHTNQHQAKKKVLHATGNYLLEHSDADNKVDIGNKILLAISKPRQLKDITKQKSERKEWIKKRVKK